MSRRIDEGRIVERRKIEDLKTGDLVQHYSTWEQTYGDAIRREVVAIEFGPDLSAHEHVVTWRDPADPDAEPYQTRKPSSAFVDVIVGVPDPQRAMFPLDAPHDTEVALLTFGDNSTTGPYRWQIRSTGNVVKVWSSRHGCLITLNPTAARRLGDEFAAAMTAAADSVDRSTEGHDRQVTAPDDVADRDELRAAVIDYLLSDGSQGSFDALALGDARGRLYRALGLACDRCGGEGSEPLGDGGDRCLLCRGRRGALSRDTSTGTEGDR